MRKFGVFVFLGLTIIGMSADSYSVFAGDCRGYYTSWKVDPEAHCHWTKPQRRVTVSDSKNYSKAVDSDSVAVVRIYPRFSSIKNVLEYRLTYSDTDGVIHRARSANREIILNTRLNEVSEILNIRALVQEIPNEIRITGKVAGAEVLDQGDLDLLVQFR